MISMTFHDDPRCEQNVYGCIVVCPRCGRRAVWVGGRISFSGAIAATGLAMRRQLGCEPMNDDVTDVFDFGPLRDADFRAVGGWVLDQRGRDRTVLNAWASAGRANPAPSEVAP